MKISDIINEASPSDRMGYMGDIGTTGPHGGDPVVDPALFPGLPGASKPKVSIKQAKDMGIIKSDPTVWRRGETPAQSVPQASPASSAQLKAQELLKGQGFKEPTTTKSNGRIEPIFKEPAEPAMRAAEPKSNMEKNIDYWQTTMPTNTLGGKVVDKLMGKQENLKEAEKQLNHDELLQDPKVQKMLNLIGRAEGADYDTIVGGKKKIQDFSQHPNVIGLRTAQGPSRAAGKYQITKGTYDKYAPRLGITDFSPASQDKIALQLLHDSGALKDVLKGKFKSAIEKAGGTWMSLPSSKIVQGQGPRSWDWAAKNLKDAGTATLAAAVGAKDAKADELPRVTSQAEFPKTSTITTAPKAIKQMSVPAGAEADLGADLSMLFGKAKKMPDGSWETGLGTKLNAQKSAEAERRAARGEKTTTDQIVDKISNIIPDKIKRVTPPFLGGKGELPSKVFSPEPVKAPPTLAKTVTDTKPADVKVATATPTTSIRSEFEKEFARQRAEQGAGGKFDWTNPATGKSMAYTTDYKNEVPKSKVAESINTELKDILKLAGRIK
jgi:muramidase (phage lysozyme)